MRKIRNALVWILALPFPVGAQDLGYQLSLFGGSGRPVQPGYFRNDYRSSAEFGARLCILFTDRSGMEFDFASFTYRLDGPRLTASLAASGVPDASASDGNISMDTATLSYLYFLTSAENGAGIYALAGIGMDRVEAEAIRITAPGPGPEAPADRYVNPVNAGFSTSLCAGLGLAVPVSGNFSVFGEARIHFILVKGASDVVSGGRAKDFIEFWTPTAGLRYGF
jgi:hypothetical protein